MLTKKRREEMIKILENAEEPLTGNRLAELFNVSRQVIVQDIALIRATGLDIIATSNGYILYKKQDDGIIKSIVCNHNSLQGLEEELRIMVNNGGIVLDVCVDHTVYGNIKRELNLRSIADVEEFVQTITEKKASPLATLTGGKHIHHVKVMKEKDYIKIMEKLGERGYLEKKND
jgi:transcriptional regulator of NAD metabolism